MIPQPNELERQFFMEMTKELDKMYISWDNEIEEWYVHAMKAFEHESLNAIQLSEAGYGKIIETSPEGINYNAFAYLIKAVAKRTAAEMGMTCKDFYALLLMNKQMGQYFEAAVAPIRKSVEKRIEIMSATRGSLKRVK